jgi:hypothetical protein
MKMLKLHLQFKTKIKVGRKNILLSHNLDFFVGFEKVYNKDLDKDVCIFNNLFK